MLDRVVERFENTAPTDITVRGWMAIATNDELPPALTDVAELIGLPSCRPELLLRIARALRKHERGPVDMVAFRLLSRSDLPGEAIEEIAQHGLEVAAAGHPACPPHVLENLAGRAAISQRLAVAVSPACPPKLAVRLVNDPDQRVRAAAAANSVLPEWALQTAAKDEAERVRAAVARNSNCPYDLLERLSRDESPRVRATIAMSPSTPQEMLERLTRDEDSRVRRSAAGNPVLPPEVRVIAALS